MICRKPINQTGVALISVILITAMITSMTVALAISQTYNTQKVSNVLAKDRITLLLEDAEQLAASEIVSSRKRGQREAEVSNEDNSEETHDEFVLMRDELRVEAKLESLNAHFNLNNLDTALGARLVRAAGGAAGASMANTPGNENSNGSFTPGESTDGRQSSVSPQNAPTPNDTNPTARLCDNTLNCEWWQYAPQGYVEENRAAELADAANSTGVDEPLPANQPAGLNPALPSQTPSGTTENATSQQSAPASAGRAGLTAQQIAQMRLTNLFRALDIDTNLIPALLDWIDEDSETRYPNGAEDDYYMNLEHAYRAANQGLASLRELLLIKGFDREIYTKLRPHLSIFPLATKINVNTASKEILMSLSPFIDSGTAEMLISAREVQAFQSVQAFLEHPLVRGRFVNKEGLSVDSDFYMLDADLQSERLSVKASSYLYYSNFRASTVKRAIGYVQ